MLAGRRRELRVGSRIYTVDRTGYKLVRQTTTPTAGSSSTDLQKREFTRTSRRSLIRKTLLGRPLGPPRAPHRRLTTRHCTFYNRFGRCNAGSACPYLHDPARVAICSRFLRGACTDTDCLFSHDLSPERIPLCHHFQHGACDRDNCPYLHIKMAASAPICRPFAYDGFCAQGRDCPQRHVYECPAFHETGECTRPKCKLTHVPARTPRATSGPAARPTPRPPTARLVAPPPPKARRYMEVLDGLETDETATEQAFDHSAIGTAELSSTVDSNFIPLVESDSEEG
ncbi:hypothetical protein IWQ60_004837 [Tieghemiomyces parasiticus]|uniref:C3H1-type domain-containing protein n=1 Tax=Tieghemiomyces parasiticus TaxID=78921 RepID=A0A9W8ACX1_9FUNG|nr:hypothetical protein IWQ60_004837 [Tieghemiomyces parasiticus]